MVAPTPPPGWAAALGRLSGHLSTDFLGGPRLLQLNWVINAQKGGTALFVGGLMWLYGNGSAEAWTYLALHGTYGFCWILKDVAFPDPRWKVRITLGGAFMAFVGVLGLYWVAPWLLISPVLQPRPPAPQALLAFTIALHTFGLSLMIAADAQRHFVLRYRKGLITDGMFRYVRRPNYLGEMMVYASYALLVRHWIPWVILAWVWLFLFLPNMLMTDASLSRHEGWEAYKARTGLLLPRFR
jgi:steroid 5-alpha reductase family enzyme